MLLPLVESCLPEEILRTWQRNDAILGVSKALSHQNIAGATGNGDCNTASTSKDRLERLMHFIRAEVEGELKVNLAMSGFGVTSTAADKGVVRKRTSQGKQNYPSQELPTAAGLLTADKSSAINCVFCGGGHRSADCGKAQKMTILERRKLLESKRCCYSCLRVGHLSKRCRNRPRCASCGRGHYAVMCGESHSPRNVDENRDESLRKATTESLANTSSVPDVQLQTLSVTMKGIGIEKKVRAIIDSASQRSYILKDTAAEMKYDAIREEDIQHALFGGTTTSIWKHNIFKVHLASADGKYSCCFDVLDQPVICGRISPVCPGPWIEELKEMDVELTDFRDGPIEILIGADVAGKLLTGGHRRLDSGLVAVETKLGWTLMGRMPGQHRSESPALVTTMLSKEATSSDLWTLDAIGITNPSEKKSQQELQHVLDQCNSSESVYDRHMLDILKDSFYVDNCVTSVADEQERKNFVEEATAVMSDGRFHLRGWEHTDPLASSSASVSNVLGMLWDRKEDTLQISISSLNALNVERITKRIILSAAHRVFDPLGITCGVSLLPKLLLQQTWKSDIGWDQEVDEDIRLQFQQWMGDLSSLAEIRFPRWLSGTNGRENWSLHVFCDASQAAYATAVFLRAETPEGVRVQLVQARARVSPISKTNKRVTIPRLELLAATIGARLYSSIVSDLGMHKIETIFWSDSTTVLAWIGREDFWDVFVGNRVKEIRELTVGHPWIHVPGSLNPADLPSRGCSPKKLLESKWWEGPDWLKDAPCMWPNENIFYDEEEIKVEKRKGVTSSMIRTSGDRDWYYKYFSKYKQIVYMIGWIYRFKHNCKLREGQRVKGILTCEEISNAETKLLMLVQQDAFTCVDDEKLLSLSPYVDGDGLIRLRTKISHREDKRDFCNPIVLPNHQHVVVFRLILDVHRESSHAGVQLMISILREKYWILGGRRTIRQVLDRCQICKRQRVKRLEALPTPLPLDRVRNAKVFELVGVDLAGPLYVKGVRGDSTKVWVCLFTCGVYRAVHLELLSSLSTDCFLQGFRRFIARRGRPNTVYSDNGTNFLEADNACGRLDWDKIGEYSAAQRIKWKFNPPTASWWGGWWERLIGLLKQLLRRVLGRASLTFEELQTILCDCEAVMNSRPLTYVSECPSDLAPLTPNLFLREVEEVGVPDFDLVEACDLKKRLRYRQSLREILRKRFRSEYLGQLKLAGMSQPPRKIRVGEVVLVGSDNKTWLDLPLARVSELLPGRDGAIRLIRLKSQSGELLRPVQRVYPLELDCSNKDSREDTTSQLFRDNLKLLESEVLSDCDGPEVQLAMNENKESLVTRKGRKIKVPVRLDL